jgi:two-component system cell cycle sensor histidine kinase PleC
MGAAPGQLPTGGDGAMLPAERAGAGELFGPQAGGALLGLVFDRGPPFWVSDGQNRLLFANRAFHEAGGEGLVAGQARAVEQVIASGEPVLRHETTTVDGLTRTFRLYMFPIAGRQQKTAAVGGLLHEATNEVRALGQARREKQRFQDILRSTSDWVWETDAQGRLSFVSDRITEVLGTPPVLLRGKTLAEIGIFGDGSDSDQGVGLPTAGAAHQPFRDAPFRIVGADGDTRHFSLSGVPSFDETGKFAGYRGTATDVTERLAAEAAVRRYQAKLEHALETLHNNNIELDVALQQSRAAVAAKSEFLATMSHELRTPLNAIIGFSEVMTSGELRERHAEYAGDILNAGRHLLAMIDGILDLARIENVNLHLDIQPAEFAAIADEALALVEQRAAEKRIRLVRPDAAAAARIAVDRARALQILVNLLGNAVKFTPDGGSVTLAVAPPEDDSVVVRVLDTGPGIPAERQAVIFDKFQQLHDSIFARRHEGIGLGLTLSRQLARAMGGELRLEQSSPAGSCFAVTFRLA